MMLSNRLRATTVALTLAAIALGSPYAGAQSRDDRQVGEVLRRLTSDVDRFTRNMATVMSRRPYERPGDGVSIRQHVTELSEAIGHINDHYQRRQLVRYDVEEALNHGVAIDRWLQSQPETSRTESGWAPVRSGLDRLATLYDLSWNWTDPRFDPEGGEGVYRSLTGTYQLQPARGDDPRALADRAASQVPADRRARVSRTLVNRLTPPDILALERTGRRVSMASTRGPRATFDVDGVEREETGAAGRRVFTRATLHGDQLVVSTTGSRGGDYTVTFEPIDNGGTMRVTRAITDPDLRVPVTARSFYRRTSTQARWDLYSERPVGALGGDDPREPRGTAGGFIVPDGTRLTARLDTPLSTRTAREGDRFTLTVQGPSEYAGAVIDGIVSQVSASDRLKGRADISLSFDTIRQRGRTSPFGGMIESIRTANGESVRVDREGQIEETDSRSEKAIERGAIGAAIGAVLGAVIGGGKGAAIGAVIGAGGGAGTVIADGREQLDLARGTEITITAAAPR